MYCTCMFNVEFPVPPEGFSGRFNLGLPFSEKHVVYDHDIYIFGISFQISQPVTFNTLTTATQPLQDTGKTRQIYIFENKDNCRFTF